MTTFQFTLTISALPRFSPSFVSVTFICLEHVGHHHPPHRSTGIPTMSLFGGARAWYCPPPNVVTLGHASWLIFAMWTTRSKSLLAGFTIHINIRVCVCNPDIMCVRNFIRRRETTTATTRCWQAVKRYCYVCYVPTNTGI